MNEQREVTFTPKLPLLIAGVVALVLGVISTARGKLVLAIILLALGGGFLVYSFQFKNWCAVQHGAWGGAWGESTFGDTLGACLKEKGWFAF